MDTQERAHFIREVLRDLEAAHCRVELVQKEAERMWGQWRRHEMVDKALKDASLR